MNLGLLSRLFFFGAALVFFTLAVVESHWVYAIPLAGLIVLSTWNLSGYVNSVNRKLAFFFDAVRNEDSTLHFPEDVGAKSMQHLHKSFNRINQTVSEIKIRSEHNERFFMEFMKHSATGLMVVDEAGYVDIINDKALRFCNLGYISHIQRLNQSNKALYEALEEIQPGQTRTLKWLEGSEIQQVSLKVVAITFREKKYRIYSLYDIKAELEENELETWQKLIRIMTHEIMNSIAPITSISNTLSRFFVKEDRMVSAGEITQKEVSDTIHGLAVIEERSEGLMHFVDNYRKLTKIPKPSFKPIQVKEWMQRIALLVSKRMEEENIALSIHYEYNNSTFPGDEKLLTQVIINLLNNAADALAHTADKKINIIISLNKEGKLKISITDNGSGFTDEELDNIFIPFYTTKENGSGIGLSLSRQIMRLHKGSISARSNQGKETVFELVF